MRTPAGQPPIYIKNHESHHSIHIESPRKVIPQKSKKTSILNSTMSMEYTGMKNSK